MYGWRSSIGIICPKDNMIVEPEFNEVTPEGISVHATRLSTVNLDEMPEVAEEEAENLSQMGADVVVYACNASSFYDGPDSHVSIREQLEAASSLPATTASTAILEALSSLDITNVDVVTPYGETDNKRLRRFLEGNDIEIEDMSGLGFASDEVEDLARVNDETAKDTYHRVLETENTGDGMLVVSTNLASMETIEAMEEDIGKPVITVNQAMIWHALELSGSSPSIRGYGELLEQ